MAIYCHPVTELKKATNLGNSENHRGRIIYRACFKKKMSEIHVTVHRSLISLENYEMKVADKIRRRVYHDF